jgi:hypothetical protein
VSRDYKKKRPDRKLGRKLSVDVRPAANSAIFKGLVDRDFKRAMQAAAIELTKRGMARGHAFALVKREMRAIIARAPSPEEIEQASDYLGIDVAAHERQVREIARTHGMAAGYLAKAETLAFELTVLWMKQHLEQAAAMPRGSPAYWKLLTWAVNEVMVFMGGEYVPLPV